MSSKITPRTQVSFIQNNTTYTMLKNIRFNMALVVIPVAIVLAYFIYHKVFGNPSNFEDGLARNEPLNGNWLGIIYTGGPLVILLITFQLIMVAYVVERFIAIRYSAGRGNLSEFIIKIKHGLVNNDIEGMIKACDKQKGAVANVVKTGLTTYLRHKKSETADQKDIYLIQKELEEATQLEIPLLNMNMFILSTIAQIATLIGLLGTVTGMIQAFAALSKLGEPDAVGLAGGISEALVTTALGISIAAVTIVCYNYFVNKIERIVYAIDEATFSIVHSLKIKFFDINE
ncbi:MAG: MotA/TolQ/ExbB proton channel family protein [Saprospiraceae bacterium]|nr:MotA/TolQ/ExbB proton channel family protein [Saprospiraceae bacterium]